MTERERKDYGPPPKVRYTYSETLPDGSSAMLEMVDEAGNPIEAEKALAIDRATRQQPAQDDQTSPS